MPAAVKPASFFDVVKTVFAGAIGIRRRADHERAPVRPAQIVVAGIAFAILFVLTLVAIVKIVLSQA